MPRYQILLLEVVTGDYPYKRTLETYIVQGTNELDKKVSELKKQYEGREDRDIKVSMFRD